MRAPSIQRSSLAAVLIVSALSSAPALGAPAPTPSSAAATALLQYDPILAPQKGSSTMIATAPISRTPWRAPMAVQTIPVTLTVNPGSIIGGSASATCTITVQEVPAEGGDVLVSCDYPSILSSPSGSWPYTLHY